MDYQIRIPYIEYKSSFKRKFAEREKIAIMKMKVLSIGNEWIKKNENWKCIIQWNRDTANVDEVERRVGAF